MTAIYYQSIEYIFKIHKSRVIIKIKGGGRDFFFIEEFQPINVDGMIGLETSPCAVSSDLGTGHQ